MNDTTKELIKPTAALGATCLIVTALLAVTNYFTAPVIAMAGNEKEAAALNAVLPQGEDFKPLELTAEGVTSAYKAENGAGYAITATAQGYHGEITVMFGIDQNGFITGAEVLEQSETKGLGDRITGDAFRGEFTGKTGRLTAVKGAAGGDEISVIAGATASSTAMTNAANTALAAYSLAKGM